MPQNLILLVYHIATNVDNKELWNLAINYISDWWLQISEDEWEESTYLWLMTEFGAMGKLCQESQILARKFEEITINPFWLTNIRLMLK